MSAFITQYSDKYYTEIQELLKKDIHGNTYLLCDLEDENLRHNFRLFLDDNKLRSLLFHINDVDFNIFWIYGYYGSDKLLENIKSKKFIIIAESEHRKLLSETYKNSKIYEEITMFLSNVGSFDIPGDINVRQIKKNEYSLLADTLNDGKHDKIYYMNKAKLKLKNNSVYGYFINNKIVSIAAIDVMSKYGCAIGGVYTLLEYRNKGYARSVISKIIQNCIIKNNITLFVRKDNYPAIKLYNSMGFKNNSERIFVDNGTGVVP